MRSGVDLREGEEEEASAEEWWLRRPRAGGGNARDSLPHNAAHGQGCAAGSGEGSELGFDLRHSAGRSGSAWSSLRMENQSRGGDKKIQGAVMRVRPLPFWAHKSVTSRDEFADEILYCVIVPVCVKIFLELKKVKYISIYNILALGCIWDLYTTNFI